MALPTLSAEALTTLDAVRDSLAVDATKANDDIMLRLINAASTLISRATNRVFGFAAGIVEDVAGFGTTRIIVSRTPMTALTAISSNDGPVDLTNVTFDPAAGLIERPGGWSWSAHSAPDIGHGPIPTTERKLIEVTYSGGYVLPKDDPPSTRTLPFDLEDACIQLVRQRWFERKRDPGVVSEKLMSWSANYRSADGELGNINPATAEVIRAYRKHFVGSFA